MNNEQLYDHYKDTNDLCRNAQKQRDRYFLLMCFAIFILLMLSAYPDAAFNMISEGIKELAGFTPSISLQLLQSFCWILYLWVALRYYQRSVYVERTYQYIDTLEKKLGITREGADYASNYPILLNVIHIIYQWFFPMVIVTATIGKIVWEYFALGSVVLLIVDSFVSLLIVLSTIMYCCFVYKCSR